MKNNVTYDLKNFKKNYQVVGIKPNYNNDDSDNNNNKKRLNFKEMMYTNNYNFDDKTKKQIFKSLQKYYDSQTKAINAKSKIAVATALQIYAKANKINTKSTIKKQEIYWKRTIDIVGSMFSFGTPLLILIYLNSALDKIALSTLFITGKTIGTVVNVAELGVRNIVPFTVNVLYESGKYLKNYVPDFVKSIGKNIYLTNSQYVTNGIIEKSINNSTNQISIITQETIMFGCLLFYLIVSLSLWIIFILILKINNMKKVSFWFGIPGFCSVNGK